MSSDESDAASSVPSSLLSNSSREEPQISPVISPVKLFRKYGRVYREVNTCFEDSCTSIDIVAVAQDNIAVISGVSREAMIHSLDGDESDSTSASSSSSCQSSNDRDIIGSDSSSVGSDSDSTQDSDSTERSSTQCSDSSVGIECVHFQKLFSGSKKKNTDEAVLALMDLFIKRRWKITTLKDVLNFCNDFFPSNMPRSIYKLFQYVESLAPENYCENSNYYCSDCLTLKEGKNTQCQECDSTSTGVFFHLPLSPQIRHCFEQRNLAFLIDSHKGQICNDRNYISDINGSEGYRKLKTKVKGNYDITLLFNSDGVSPVHSSNAHLYPLLATICELPPHLRPNFMIICGIWYDVKFAPDVNTFLSPFVKDLSKIYEESIVWTHPTTKEQYNSIVTAPVMSADALVRADILVMQHHNAKYDCNNCEQKTKRFRPADGKKIRRYLYQEKSARLREQDNTNKQGRKAAEGLPVKGILGDAVVSELPRFDRGTSAPPEYMHSVLLGIVKQFNKLWFKTPGEWNIKDKTTEIDNFILKNVTVTDEYVRVPKGIKDKDLKLWKASDLRVWLLFISLPALHGHLKEKYFQHWMLLVGAIYLLLKEKISASDITMAETKLRIFVRDIAKLSRLQDYTYNVHNLLHLAQHVKRWGPLWATSAFPFENFNHILGELAHGPKHKGKQIVNKIKLANGLEVLRNKVLSQSQMAPAREGAVLGQPGVIDLDLTTFNLPCNTKVYLRANLKGTIFTAQLYDQKVRRANSFVCFETEHSSVAYGQILGFYEECSKVNCLIQKFKVEQRKIFSHNKGRFSLLHLVPISETGHIISSSAMSLLSKHAKVWNFLCVRPNVIEKNL